MNSARIVICGLIFDLNRKFENKSNELKQPNFLLATFSEIICNHSFMSIFFRRPIFDMISSDSSFFFRWISLFAFNAKIIYKKSIFFNRNESNLKIYVERNLFLYIFERYEASFYNCTDNTKKNEAKQFINRRRNDSIRWMTNSNSIVFQYIFLLWQQQK